MFLNNLVFQNAMNIPIHSKKGNLAEFIELALDLDEQIKARYQYRLEFDKKEQYEGAEPFFPEPIDTTTFFFKDLNANEKLISAKPISFIDLIANAKCDSLPSNWAKYQAMWEVATRYVNTEFDREVATNYISLWAENNIFSPLPYDFPIMINKLERDESRLTKLYHFTTENTLAVLQKNIYKVRIFLEGLFPNKEYYLVKIDSDRLGYDIDIRSKERIERVYVNEPDTNPIDLGLAMSIAEKLSGDRFAKLL